MLNGFGSLRRNSDSDNGVHFDSPLGKTIFIKTGSRKNSRTDVDSKEVNSEIEAANNSPKSAAQDNARKMLGSFQVHANSLSLQQQAARKKLTEAYLQSDGLSAKDAVRATPYYSPF